MTSEELRKSAREFLDSVLKGGIAAANEDQIRINAALSILAMPDTAERGAAAHGGAKS